MQEWLSWRPVWKLFVCWPSRRRPGRLRSSCRTRFTSTWDRYAVTLVGVRLCVLSFPAAVMSEQRAAVRQILNVHLMVDRSQDTGHHSLLHLRLWRCQLLRMFTLTSVCCESLSYSNQTIELGRRREGTRSGLMNHFLLFVASCAYGRHLAKEAIAPDWRAGGGNVRLSAIFSWRTGSCCSCDITLTHTSYHSIFGDFALSDWYNIIHEWF